jgi:RNA polymerase sigma-70 factor (ECF subfamily)
MRVAESDGADRPDEAGDAWLMAALRRGDAAGVRALYARYSPRIFRFLYRMAGDRAVADDLHQETWLAVARHATTLRPDSDVAAWLFTIARNKHGTWRRWRVLDTRLRRDLREDASDARAGPAGGGAQAGGRAGLAPELHDLEAALMRLPTAAREILVLMGCEALDATQAAEILETTPEAVRQRLSRARALLRRLWSADDEATRPALQDRGKGVTG